MLHITVLQSRSRKSIFPTENLGTIPDGSFHLLLLETEDQLKPAHPLHTAALTSDFQNIAIQRV